MTKKISLLLAFVLLFSSLAALNACDSRSPVDTSSTETPVVPATTTVVVESNTQAATTSPTVATTEASEFEYVLLSENSYGIKALKDTAAVAIAIPESYNGKPITKILGGAFKDATRLTSLMIPDTVLEMEKGAFFGCSSLEEIVLPFIGAKPSTKEPLGYLFGKAFFSGAQKAEQMLENADGTFRSENFYVPSTLKKVTVTGGVIRTYAFMECSMIQELVFADGVTAIESGAFYFCDSLETVSMGASITEISDECFFALTSLKNVTIGKNVTKIGYNAFSSCTSLRRIIIPRKVSVIEKYAFDQCTGMESIIFEQTSGWYRDYGSASGTGMDVTNPGLNAKNLTDGREYSSDRWKRR